jgi:predicted dehydrogenase
MGRSNTRRSFLRRGTGLVAGVVAPSIIPGSALGLGGAVAPSERITLACLGFGTIAHSTVRSFLNKKGVQVVAVADVQSRAGHYGYQGELEGGRDFGKELVEAHYGEDKPEGFKGCDAVVDFRELLGRDDIDAVNVSTPDHWHGVMAIMAARAGKAIYGQKPLSLTVAEGRAMVAAVEEAGVTWQTGSQQRSDVHFRRACELVRNGYLGKVHTVKVGLPGGHNDWSKLGGRQAVEAVPEGLDWDLWLGPAPEREFRPALHPLNWRHNFDFSGGMVTDFGAHHIDIAQWALDRDGTGPVKFEKVGGTMPGADELYNTAAAFHFEAIYEDGVRMVVADTDELGFSGVRFEGEDGRWLWVDRGRLESAPETIIREQLGDDAVRLYESADHEGNFVESVRSGEPTAAPIEAAHRTITIAHLANLALRGGVESFGWDPQAETSDSGQINAGLGRAMRGDWL